MTGPPATGPRTASSDVPSTGKLTTLRLQRQLQELGGRVCSTSSLRRIFARGPVRCSFRRAIESPRDSWPDWQISTRVPCPRNPNAQNGNLTLRNYGHGGG